LKIKEIDIVNFLRLNKNKKNINTKKDKIISQAICYLTGNIKFTPEMLNQTIANFKNEDDFIKFVNDIHYVLKNKSYNFLLNYPKTINKEFISYFQNNVEEIAILSAFAKLQYEKFDSLSSIDETVIDAIQRSTDELSNANIDEIADYLNGMNEGAIEGFISNVKGILHEIKFTELENLDGDNITAMLFENTNHPSTDVNLLNILTGEETEIQLKATDSIDYVNEYLEENEDEVIKVTEELAEKYNLESSGISNAEITEQVEETVDSISKTGKSMWNYFPTITMLSISILIYLLWRKKRKNEITKKEFYHKSLKLSGLKISKVVVITFLLSIPGINYITSIVLITRQIYFVNKMLK